MKKSRLRYLREVKRRQAIKKRLAQQHDYLTSFSDSNPNNVDFDLIFDWVGEPCEEYCVIDGITVERICHNEILVLGEWLGGPNHCESCKAIWQSPKLKPVLDYINMKLAQQ